MPVVYTGAIKRSANRRNRFRATLRRQIHSRWSCSIEQIQNTECKTETSNDVTEQAPHRSHLQQMETLLCLITK
jgi:hypothetical protein